MKKIEFDLRKGNKINLADLHEGTITLKRVIAEDDKYLDQFFVIKTEYGSKWTQQSLYLKSGRSVFSQVPITELDYKIEDSDNSTLEANTIYPTKYIIEYETTEDKLQGLKTKEQGTKQVVNQALEIWLSSVNGLFNNIIEWAKPLSKEVTIQPTDHTIVEELTGEYQTRKLSLFLNNNKTITFTPFGTFLIGSKGRVDISFIGVRNPDSMMLILIREETGEEKWLLATNRDFSNAKIFNKARLYNLIEYVIER